MQFTFTEEEINRSKLLDPGVWYNAQVIKVYEDRMEMKDKDNPGSKISVAQENFDSQIIDGPFKGAMLYIKFNEKYQGFAIPFLKAFRIEVRAGERYDTKAIDGRKFQVFVKHREYQGKYYNDPVDFRPFPE